MEIKSIALALVRRSADARPLDAKAVESIAASFREVGQISPITVCAQPVYDGIMVDGYRVIAGNHRFAAAQALGWAEVQAIVVSGSALENELIEIDENLCRAELSAAQRTVHIKRRKQIWEALHPGPSDVPASEREAAGSNGASRATTSKNGVGQGVGGGRPKEFAAATAEVTGESKSTINRQLAVADALGEDLQKVEGTSLDKGVELQALARLPETERKKLVERAASGEQVSARAPLLAVTQPKPSQIAALVAMVNRIAGEIPTSMGCRNLENFESRLRSWLADAGEDEVTALQKAMSSLGDVVDVVGDALYSRVEAA